MMTDEELDEARIAEARRLTGGWALCEPVLMRSLARLAREGWMPTDPLLIEAREIVGNHYDGLGYLDTSKEVRAGRRDKSFDIQCALNGIKRGVEIGKAQS